MRSSSFELKIGIFIFIGIILLIAVTFSIGDFLFEPGYHINVLMNFADGVQEAAPVRLSGVDVGEVKKTTIFKDPETKKTKVKLRLWLTNEAEVEKDSKVIVNTLGLIGEKYVEIMPGTPGEDILRNGDTIVGFDSISMQSLTQKGFDIAVKMETMIDSINDLLGKVKNGQGTIGKLLTEDKIHQDLEIIVSDIKEMIKDIKRQPWKLLHKPKEPKTKTEDKDKKRRQNF